MAGEKMKEKLRQLITRFKELQGDPGYLARGVTIGTFLGFAPLLPFKTILILLLTMVIPSSTVAAILCTTLICNPLTYVPLYYLAWYIGNLLLPGRASWEILNNSLQLILAGDFTQSLSLVCNVGFDTGVVILTGGMVLAIIPTIIVYPLAIMFFYRLQKKRYKRHVLK